LDVGFQPYRSIDVFADTCMELLIMASVGESGVGRGVDEGYGISARPRRPTYRCALFPSRYYYLSLITPKEPSNPYSKFFHHSIKTYLNSYQHNLRSSALFSITPPTMSESKDTQESKGSTDPKYDDLHKQLFEEGLKMRRSVVGDTYVNRALENGSTSFSRAGQELVTEWCWGYAWTRPGLSKQQRSLMNIGMLMALNRAPELAVHIRGARNNGLSEVEIREAILHATTYLGVPAGVDAFKVAERVLDEMAERGECERELGGRSERA